MKYRLEVWRYRNPIASYEDDDIQFLVQMFKEDWVACYEEGSCTLYVYEDGRELSIDEEFELGFYD